MLDKMFQYLTHAYDLPHVYFMRLKQEGVVVGMDYGQSKVPPNIEQWLFIRRI